MSVRERILMLRLMEKLQKHPDFARSLGVEAHSTVENPNGKPTPRASPKREALSAN